MITLVLAGRVPPGGRAALEGFLTEATPFYEAPGGIRVRLLWDRAEPDSFVEIVEYADEAAYAADQHRVDEDPAMAAHLTRWRSLLAGPPTVTVYDDATRPAAPPRPAPPAPAPPAPAPPAPPGSGTDRGPEVAEPFPNPTGGALAATPAPLPRTIGAPARRALEAAGYTDLAQLDGVPRAELLRLHGMGPTALARLQAALGARGGSLT